MLAGEGLHPSSKGARVQFSGDERTVDRRAVRRDQGADRRLLAARRSSRRTRRSSGSSAARTRWTGESEIEIRQVFEAEDFGDELHARAARAGGAPARAGRERPAARRRATCRERRRRTRAIDAVWRIESARLIAGLARIVRDVGLAEDLAQDALVAALEQWPRVGRPGQPGRLADGHRQAPRDRPPAPRRRCSSASTRSSAASSRSGSSRRAGPRRRARRRRRRRPAAAGLHRLPPGAVAPRRASR